MTSLSNRFLQDLFELAGFCSAVGSDMPSWDGPSFSANLFVSVTTHTKMESSMFEKLFLGAVSTFVAVVLLLALLQIAEVLIQ